MEMISIICFIFAAYGLSNLLVYGSGPFNILGKIREKSYEILPTIGEMLECMMCTSTNIGWIISLIDILFLTTLNITPFNILIDNNALWYIIIPMDAFITSGCVWLLHTAQEMLESITNKNNDNGNISE